MQDFVVVNDVMADLVLCVLNSCFDPNSQFDRLEFPMSEWHRKKGRDCIGIKLFALE